MRKLASTLLTLCALACVACQTATEQPGQGRSIRWKTRGIAESQVAADTVQFLRQFEALVSSASYEIQDSTTDPRIRRNAMQWRILMVPAAQSAAFQPTPTRGLIDLWALVLQMDQYLREGEGRDMFGEHQPIALAASASLVEGIRALEPDLPGEDAGTIRATIEQWSARNPIQGEGFSRPSTASAQAHVAGQQTHSLGETVRSIDHSIADLTARLTVYAGSLPRQSRWQAELILDGFLRTPQMEGMYRDLAATADGVARVAELEQILSEQVSRIEGTIEAERAEVLRDVERQRMETLATIAEERRSVLADVERQRLETVEAVQKQTGDALDRSESLAQDVLASVRETRERLVEVVDEEHRRVFEDAEALAERTVDRSMGQARGLVDHIALRAVQGGSVLILLAFLTAVAYRKLTR